MKKGLVLSVFVLMIAAACHKKAAPTSSTTTAPDATTASVAVAAPDAATLEAGKTIYTTKCTKCHAAKPVENYTTDKWTGILKAMIPKAKLDETESAQVTAFVNAGAKK